MTTETLYRITTVLEPDSLVGRRVSGVIVPYGEDTLISEGRHRYTERFAPGSFARSLKERGHKIRLHVMHDQRRLPIGRPVTLEERAAGLFGEFAISETTAGDDALVSIRDGLVGGFSVGFRPIRDDRKGDTVTRLEAALAEVSLVSEPAYSGALISGVRSIDPYAPKPLTVAAARRRLLDL